VNINNRSIVTVPCSFSTGQVFKKSVGVFNSCKYIGGLVVFSGCVFCLRIVVAVFLVVCSGSFFILYIGDSRSTVRRLWWLLLVVVVIGTQFFGWCCWECWWQRILAAFRRTFHNTFCDMKCIHGFLGALSFHANHQ
jgi:hypothetical protein